MNKPLVAAAAGVALFCAGCSSDIMYGPDGEIVKMKSPKKTMKITFDDDEIEIEGVRGIAGTPRVRMPAVPADPEPAQLRGIAAPPPGPVLPVAPAGAVERRMGTAGEDETVVR